MNTTTPEPTPTYWLRNEEGSITGPFTKSQARTVVENSPHDHYQACRDDEEWQDAAVRLAPAAKSNLSEIAVALGIAAAIGAGILGWSYFTEAKADEEAALRKDSDARSRLIGLGNAAAKHRRLTEEADRPTKVNAWQNEEDRADHGAWLEAMSAADRLAHSIDLLEYREDLKGVRDKLHAARLQAKDVRLQTRIELIYDVACKLLNISTMLSIKFEENDATQTEASRERWLRERDEVKPEAERLASELASLRISLADWEKRSGDK